MECSPRHPRQMRLASGGRPLGTWWVRVFVSLNASSYVCEFEYPSCYGVDHHCWETVKVYLG